MGPFEGLQTTRKITSARQLHCDCGLEYYEQLVLPFGGTASVYNFNWVARGILYIMVVLFCLMSTHYFDDYACLEFDSLADHTQVVVDSLFSLLGWQTKEQIPFATAFSPLGVVCDLGEAPSGVIRFTNKKSRVDEIAQDVQRIAGAGFIRRAEARSIRGRVLFSRAQVFGKVGASALQALGKVADCTEGSPALGDRAIAALQWLVAMLQELRPREISVRHEPPLLLFVDGAYEDPGSEPVVTVGAVLFDPTRPERGPRYFGQVVGPSLVGWWAKGNKNQLIGQAELLPVLLAKHTWSDAFRNRRCFVFIDNNSARYSLVNGYSPVLDSSQIISDVWLCDATQGVSSWYARVPTASNIADGPSRLRFEVVRSYPNAKCSSIQLPPEWGNDDVWNVLTARWAHSFQ